MVVREFLRTLAFNTFALFATSLVFSGLKVPHDLKELLVAGLVFTVVLAVVKPIYSIVALPLTILSLGILSFIPYALTLYVIPFFYKQIRVTEFVFPNVSFLGLHIQSFHVSLLLSYAIISATIYLVSRFTRWIFEI